MMKAHSYRHKSTDIGHILSTRTYVCAGKLEGGKTRVDCGGPRGRRSMGRDKGK